MHTSVCNSWCYLCWPSVSSIKVTSPQSVWSALQVTNTSHEVCALKQLSAMDDWKQATDDCLWTYVWHGQSQLTIAYQYRAHHVRRAARPWFSGFIHFYFIRLLRFRSNEIEPCDTVWCAGRGTLSCIEACYIQYARPFFGKKVGAILAKCDGK
jgi:hypothetical protein